MALIFRRPWLVKPNTAALNYSLDRTRALIGYWACLEGAGLNIRDLSPNRLDCPLGQSGSTPPLWLPGKFGTSFNPGSAGSSGNFGSIPNAAILNPTVFTLEAWFCIDVTPGASHAGIIGKWATTGTMLVVLNTMVLQFYTNGTALSTAALSKGTWYHAVGTYDGTTAALYLNGQLIASGAQAFTATATPFEIGRYNQAVAAIETGRLDLGAFYNRPLTQAEIQDQYLNPLGMLAEFPKQFSLPSTEFTLTPAAGAITYTGGTPVVSLDTVFPDPATITYSPGTPVVTLTLPTLTPAAASITYAPGTPTVTTAMTLAPAAATMVYLRSTPAVSRVTTAATGSVLVINGNSYLWDENQPASITRQLSSPWSATFSVFYQSGPKPAPGDEVALFWQSVKRFGGYVLSVAETAIPGGPTASRIIVTCTGYQSLCDRRIVAKLYTLPIGGVAVVMIYDLWYDHLAQDGVTIDYPQGPIVAIPVELFHYVTVTEAFNWIKSQNPGWDWYISQNKKLIWVNNGAGPAAPFTLRNGDANQDAVSVTGSNAKFRNKQWVLPSVDLTALRVESTTTAAGQTQFQTQYALTTKPTVVVNGVKVAVDTLGDWTGAPCYYTPNGIDVAFFTAPTTGFVVDITYPSPWPLAFSAQDDASIAAIGLYESVYQAKNVTDEATAQALAQGILDMYGTGGRFQVEINFGYKSNWQSSWLDPGMVVDVDRTFPTALGNFTVEQVQSQLMSLTVWQHTVTMRFDPGDVSETFEQAFLTAGRLVITNNPAPATWQIGMDIPPIANPGLIVGLLKDVWTCPPISGGGAITIASWNGFFPVDPPTGADFIADFLLNGVSIFPVGDANKMVVPDGTATIVGGFTFVTPNLTVKQGDVLTMNIIQVGSTNPGSNAVFHLNFIH